MNTVFRHIVVAGAGTMGVTLARVFAQNGYSVILWNRREVSLEKAKPRIAADLAALHDQGRLDEAPETIAGRIQYTTDFSVYETADFVVENIAEDLTVKRDFWEKVSALVSPETVLTTNTSGLRVSDIAQAVKDPGRFCGMHWWNPPTCSPWWRSPRATRAARRPPRPSMTWLSPWAKSRSSSKRIFWASSATVCNTLSCGRLCTLWPWALPVPKKSTRP